MKIRDLKRYNAFAFWGTLILFIMFLAIIDIGVMYPQYEIYSNMAGFILTLSAAIVGAYIQYKMTNKGIDKVADFFEKGGIESLMKYVNTKYEADRKEKVLSRPIEV